MTISYLMVIISVFSCASNDDDILKPNVFLIYVDDLRPELGAYGNELIKSPQIDALADDALLFNKAYATVPVCGASRATMLTGIMPNRNRFVGYLSNAEEEVPNAITIPEYLKKNGYKTFSFGKVFHTLSDSESAWSEPPYRGPKQCNKDYALQENIAIDNANPRNRAGFFEVADTTDEAYLDGKLANKAIEKLRENSFKDDPLFMAVGFWKPHLPFTPPKKYWDLYDANALPFPSNYFPPKNAPKESLHQFAELRSYTDVPNDSVPLDSSMVIKLIHGYYASVSYVDAQIGKFIQELKDQDLYDDSIIILVGDHGWFLGEHTLWCKHANYRNALRTTLMIKFPKSENQGVTELPVGLVEVYPTLMNQIGLEVPDHIQSASFLPLLSADEQTMKLKEVYCRYEDGETLLRGDYAYTEYYKGDQLTSRMLYNHKNDLAENVNIVDEADPALLNDLAKSLAKHINAYK